MCQIANSPYNVPHMKNLTTILPALLAQPTLMGIVNVTPDSFSDGGQFADPHGGLDVAAAATYALGLAQQGAAILDIGGEASAFHLPGVVPTAPQEQIQRVVPVIAAVVGRLQEHGGPPVLISIDTRSAAVAQAALAAGASIINDISAGQADLDMLAVAAQNAVPIILMHFRDESGHKPEPYADVCASVRGYLRQRAAAALAAGLRPEHIWLDPGIGFGKTPDDNWQLIAHLDCLVALGHPVVLGASRKRFLTAALGGAMPASAAAQTPAPPAMATAPAVTGPTPSEWHQRDIATAIVTTLAAAKGVRIHRVHNVLENHKALAIAARAAKPENRLCVL